MSIKYSVFSKIHKASAKNLDIESKQSFYPSVLLFWLEHVSGSNNSMTYDKLLEDLGLLKSKKQPKLSSKLKAEKAIERSKKIIELDKKRINMRNK